MYDVKRIDHQINELQSLIDIFEENITLRESGETGSHTKREREAWVHVAEAEIKLHRDLVEHVTSLKIARRLVGVRRKLER